MYPCDKCGNNYCTCSNLLKHRFSVHSDNSDIRTYSINRIKNVFPNELIQLIPQLDGAESIFSSDSSLIDDNEDLSNYSYFPPTPPWFDQVEIEDRLPPVRIRINRDNRARAGLNLPVVATCNMRSLMPKLRNFCTDFLEREIDIGFLTEVWEKRESKTHQHNIKRMLELEGLKYISNPRINNQRGGGVALVANLRRFNLEKIEVDNPDKLEVIFGLLRPKAQGSQVKKIICCSFYFPPKSKKKTKLLDHIITTVSYLMTIHEKSGIFICGDRNEMNISPILHSNGNLRQIVSLPSRKDKILDIMITNLHRFFETPCIVPPVPADLPTGSPSDHSVPLARPIRDPNFRRQVTYQVRVFRPLPDSKIDIFEKWLENETWDVVNPDSDPSSQVENLQNLLCSKLDEIFPQKNLKLSSNDDPWITTELKDIARLKKREWWNFGKTKRYDSLKKKFKHKNKEAACKYITKNISEIKSTNPARAYRLLKKIGAHPGDSTEETTFTLSNHDAQNLTDEQSTEKIANHFSAISQKFPPLSLSLLPKHIKDLVLSPVNPDEVPVLSELDVLLKIIATKKTKSTVPGDLPKKLLVEFPAQLSPPVTNIFNSIIQTGDWARQWKKEYGTAIPKVSPPKDEDDLRIISLTNFFNLILFKNFYYQRVSPEKTFLKLMMYFL